ncbi:MAG: hypothetical protein ACK5LN_01870 [Propioniciclava sp.]
MAELALAPNPVVWQVVPGMDEAAAWYEQQIAAAPQAAREQVAAAAGLALHARFDTDLSQVLLLCDPAAELYAMLGIAALDGVPAPDTAAGAVGIAESLVPSPWPAEALQFDLAGVRGWRVTILDDQNPDQEEQVAVPQAVSTVYVASVGGRCVVAALSSLTPLAAAVAQVLAEQVVATFDVVEGVDSGD